MAPPLRECDESHWYHRVLVVWHVVASAWVGKLIIAGAAGSPSRALIAASLIYLGHKAVDPAHGLVHFTLDNYFSRTTPLIGGVIDGFLNHHDEPATISRIQLARNIAPLVALSLPMLAALIFMQPTATLPGLAAMSFLGTFFIETGFAMEAHKYAHISQERLPRTVKWLQHHQWLISSELHAKHHARRPRFDADYAAVTGRSNRYLTETVFRKAERIIYELTERLTGKGVAPRSWGERASRGGIRQP